MATHNGELPREFGALSALPGIGRSTAGAILAQAHGLPFPILDGNVRRVLCRVHGIDGWPGSAATQQTLWALAQAHLPETRLADYTQAQMDLGASVRSEEHTSELQSLMRNSYAVFCLKNKTENTISH